MQTHRRIEGLLRAKALRERPGCIPPLPKFKGAKAAGLRFEKALHKALHGSLHGQWFEYEDSLGFGYCQTDLLVPFVLFRQVIVVLECKYTLVPGAHSKLSSLYLPVVEAAFGMPAYGVVVVKNLDPRYRRGRIYTNLVDAVMGTMETGYPTLIQWSGQALLPAPMRSPVPANSGSVGGNSGSVPADSGGSRGLPEGQARLPEGQAPEAAFQCREADGKERKVA
jgi:hypothetical protein